MAVAGQNAPLILLERPKKPSINALVNSVYRSFQGIEPWYHAEMIERGLPQATVDRIVVQGDKYLIAIQDIVQTIGDGATFTKDIVALCPEEGQSIKNSPSESTLCIANTAYRSTSKTCDQLRAIRVAISEIIKRVGSYMTTKLSKDEKSAQATVIGLPKAFSDDELSKGKEIIGVTFSARGMETKTAEEVMEQLGRVEKDILELVKQVDESMAWWEWARLSLDTMQPQDGTNRRRVPDILKRWTAILAQYQKHTERINAIRSWSKGEPSLTASAVTSTSTHDPPCIKPCTHASSKINKLEPSTKATPVTVDEALEISAANLASQSGCQPIQIRLVSTAVSIAMDIVRSVKKPTNAGSDDLKRIATNACNLVCVVLRFYAEQRSNGRKMPKDLDGNLQDHVDTLINIKKIVLQVETSLSDVDVGAINKYYERIIQASAMFSL